MPSTINSDNGVVSGSSGVKTTADTSGELALQSNGVTGLTLNTSLAIGVGSGNSTGTTGQVLTSSGSGAPPTWAAIPASAGSITAIASGTLPDGSTVVINANGTVSAVSGTYANTLTLGSNTTFLGSAGIQSTAMAYDANSQRVVIAYRNQSNNQGFAVVGTVSGTSISFGTPVVFYSGNCVNIAIAYDANAAKVVIAYRDITNTNFGTAVVGTVSGTSISFGSSVVFNSGTTIDIDLVYYPTTQKVIVAYQNNSAGQSEAKVGTVSGTSISFGGANTISNTGSGINALTYDSVNDKIVVAYQSYSTSNGTARVGTVSGNSINWGTLQVFSPSVAAVQISIGYDVAAQRVVVAYQDQTNSSQGMAVVGTVSGTTISFGSPVTFNTGATVNTSTRYIALTQRTLISYQDQGNSNFMTYVVGTVSGTSISFGSENVAVSAATSANETIYDPTTGAVVMAFDVGSTLGQSVVGVFGINTNLTSQNFIGFSSAAYTNGQTATINTVGSVEDSQSGLTAGQAYYVGPTGTLSLTPGSPSVFAGTAISSTRILVKG